VAREDALIEDADMKLDLFTRVDKMTPITDTMINSDFILFMSSYAIHGSNHDVYSARARNALLMICHEDDNTIDNTNDFVIS